MSEPDTGAAASPDPGSTTAARDERGSTARRVRRSLLGLLSVLAIYYAVPVGSLPSGTGIAFSVLGLLGGVALLAWLIIRQAQRLMQSEVTDESVRLDSLIFLLYVVVPMFALGYFGIDKAADTQFVGLATKTDALYYTMSTLATVGFGDVHAAGQIARGLVTVQILFNLVFVAALVSLVTGQIRARRAAGRSAAAARPEGPADQSPGT